MAQKQIFNNSGPANENKCFDSRKPFWLKKFKLTASCNKNVRKPSLNNCHCVQMSLDKNGFQFTFFDEAWLTICLLPTCHDFRDHLKTFLLGSNVFTFLITTHINYLQYNIYSTYLQCAILTLLTILYSACNTTLTILTYNVRYATNIAIPALLFTYIKNIQLPKNYIYPLHERRGDA